MTKADVPQGSFPGTNTQPVLDGIEPVSQDPDLFIDDDEVEY